MQSCLGAVTAVQAIYDEFLSLGGFSLLLPLLSATSQHSQHLLAAVLTTLLDSSCVHIGSDRVLLYPELISVCLKFLAQIDSAAAGPKTELWSLLLQFLNGLLLDSNPGTDVNLLMVAERSDLLVSLLACFHTISREEEEDLRPLAGAVRDLLSALPAGPDTLRKMLGLTVGCLPPHLLYLPHLASPLLLTAAPGLGVNVESEVPFASQSYINKIHSTDVIGRLS